MLRLVKRSAIFMLAVLMIAALGLVQFNRSSNLHYHFDDAGRIVTHSHPYDKSDDSSPFKSHSHGKGDLPLPVGMIDMSVASVGIVLSQIPVPIISFYNESTPVAGLEDLHILRGRAPPFIAI